MRVSAKGDQQAPLVDGLAAATQWSRSQASLADAVAAHLTHEILEGVRAPGSALPSGADLCKHYSISLTVARDAMKTLAEKGLVQIRHGSGSTVREPDKWDLLDSTVLGISLDLGSDLELVDNLVATRRTLEADMARAAARNRSARDLERLGRLVDRMDEVAPDLEWLTKADTDFTDADLAFHDTIMRMSGNRVARSVVRRLTFHAHHSATYAGTRTTVLAQAANAGHRAILTSIAGSDADSAGRAMAAHITEGWLRRRPRRAVAGQHC